MPVAVGSNTVMGWPVAPMVPPPARVPLYGSYAATDFLGHRKG
jgi:hypothetical protein